MERRQTDYLKKMLIAALTLSILGVNCTAFAGTYSFAHDQYLTNNEDNYLVVKDDAFIRSPAEPESLVYRTEGGEGPRYNRYTAVTETDRNYLKSLNAQTNYSCNFQDLADYIYPGLGGGYRFLAIGISCVAK